MIDTTPENLLIEIEASETLRNQHLEEFDDQIRRYHGPHYRAGSMEQDFYPENHAFEYLSLIVPRIVLDNPRVRVSTRRPGTQGVVAEAMRHGLNRWSRDTNLSRLLIRLATDMLFNWGVAIVTQEPVPHMRYGDPKRWPVAYRIPQKLWFMDYQARHFSEARYMGHKIRRDKKDLLKHARAHPKEGWNVPELEALVTDNDDDLNKADRERSITANPRNEISYYEIWMPEVQLPDFPESKGYHGAIFTVSMQSPTKRRLEALASWYEHGRDPNSMQAATEIRKPRGFYGPRTGPYTLFGVYTVPDSSHPLAPLVATQGQQDDLNQHVQAASHADAQYKRLVFVDNMDKKLIQRVKDSGDLFVVPVSGLREGSRQIVSTELGGSSPQQWEMIAQKRERLDRNSGIFDAQRGNVAGRGTATEVAVADQSSSARMNFIEHQFQDATARLLSSISWYLYYDDRVEFPLGPEAADQMGMVEPWFKGGVKREGSGATFDDLELEIEPYSMTRTTEGLQQKRTMEMVDLVMAMAPMIPQMPWVDWRRTLKHLGDALNFPELEDVIDLQIASQFIGVEMPWSQDSGEPRLKRDAGAVGAYGQKSAAPAGPSRGRSRGQQAKQVAF